MVRAWMPSCCPCPARPGGTWRTLHVVGDFAPEVTEAYVAEGLHPRLSYFPGRAAAFGEAGPGLTIATFYVFAPWLVEAALPSAWETTTPAKLVEARRSGMAAALEPAARLPRRRPRRWPSPATSARR